MSRHIQPRMHRKGPFTVEVAGSPEVAGETKPRRNTKQPDHLTLTRVEGVDTLYEIIRHGAETYGDSPAMASRKLIKKHNETKMITKIVDGRQAQVPKSWTYFELTGYTSITYKQLRTITLQIGAGFRKLGLSSLDRVHIFAATSAHWMSIAHGAWSQSMVIVTAYDTLGEQGLRQSLKTTRSKAIFLEPHLLSLLNKVLPSAPDIKYIIYNTDGLEEIDDKDAQALKASYPHIQLLSFEDLRVLGQSNLVDPVPPKTDDLCAIMFTSGTGSTPKGVELTHKNIVSAEAGGWTNVQDALLGSFELRYLAYLPLAHIFEITMEHAVLQVGACLGYGSAKTLSQASCRNCKGDIQEWKPVFMVGIPAVWETVKKGILANVAKASKPVQALFWSSLTAKRALLRNGLPGTAVLDGVVFNKIREATGGELRVAMSGGASLAKDTKEFLGMVLCPLINGYGMTETSGMGLFGDPLAWSPQGQGEPPCGVEIKLVDYAEAGYFVANAKPQGEVWIRGPAVMKRYFEMPELTKEAFGPEEWFKTGDIGQWEKDGQLSIIDRKKNLIKTLNGEYIALEKLESIYRSAAIVMNICIYASPTETKPIAIIVPVEATLQQLAESQRLKTHGMDDPANQTLVPLILSQLLAVGRKSGLANIELIQGVVLCPEEWTALNNMTTPTNKLNRNVIAKTFEKQIVAAYKGTGVAETSSLR